MKSFPPILNKVIEGFTRFPGIGNKTAHRLGLHVLKSTNSDIEEFSQQEIGLKIATIYEFKNSELQLA